MEILIKKRCGEEKIEIKDWVVKKAKELDIDVSRITRFDEIIKLLPDNYYFNQLCLWVGDNRVELDHYDDYGNAVLKMLIKLKSK